MGLIFIYPFRNISRERNVRDILSRTFILLFSFSLSERIKKVYKVFVF